MSMSNEVGFVWMFSTKKKTTDRQTEPSDSKRYNKNGVFRPLEWRIQLNPRFLNVFFFHAAFCRSQLRLIEIIRTFNDLPISHLKIN